MKKQFFRIWPYFLAKHGVNSCKGDIKVRFRSELGIEVPGFSHPEEKKKVTVLTRTLNTEWLVLTGWRLKVLEIFSGYIIWLLKVTPFALKIKMSQNSGKFGFFCQPSTHSLFGSMVWTPFSPGLIIPISQPFFVLKSAKSHQTAVSEREWSHCEKASW